MFSAASSVLRSTRFSAFLLTFSFSFQNRASAGTAVASENAAQSASAVMSDFVMRM